MVDEDRYRITISSNRFYLDEQILAPFKSDLWELKSEYAGPHLSLDGGASFVIIVTGGLLLKAGLGAAALFAGKKAAETVIGEMSKDLYDALKKGYRVIAER